MRTKIAVLLSLVLLGCTPVLPRPAPPVNPPIPTPVNPPAPPVNPPVDPNPPPSTAVVPFEKTQGIVEKMTRPALYALLGREPDGDKPMRDGTRISRWPSLGAGGAPKWLDVELKIVVEDDRQQDTVNGYSLVPR